MKKIEKIMDLNRETAMRLWNKSFGKETKVKDFAGRTIVKGAYNDRNSDFGWNVDHILPQSKGGVTADHNLICCHISTNDEKADKFPCFNSNGCKFEIVKVQNHYEIHKREKSKKSEEDDSKVNYFDSASGVRFFKDLKGIQNKPRFVGSVYIRLKNVSNTAVVDFIEKFFDEENISYSLEKNYYNEETRVYAKNYNMPLKEDSQKLLDKCILLNTYLGHYFEPNDYLDDYDIYFRVDYFHTKEEMYYKSQQINFKDITNSLSNTLWINELVVINTEAKKTINTTANYQYYKYNYIYTGLAKNLDKEVNGK